MKSASNKSVPLLCFVFNPGCFWVYLIFFFFLGVCVWRRYLLGSLSHITEVFINHCLNSALLWKGMLSSKINPLTLLFFRSALAIIACLYIHNLESAKSHTHSPYTTSPTHTPKEFYPNLWNFCITELNYIRKNWHLLNIEFSSI